MKPFAFALLVVALHLGVAAMAASRHPTTRASESFTLVTCDPQR